MKDKTQEASKPFLQWLGQSLLNVQQEIDELALQLSLGKAEAKDKFEEVKMDFAKTIANLRESFKSLLKKSMPMAIKLKLEELELQLRLGPAENKESFDSQRTALISATIALENEIRKALENAEVSHNFKHEVEKFLLKLEILSLTFGIKRFELKDAFRSRMAHAKKAIHRFIDKTRGKKSTAQGQVIDEVSKAYKHLRSAIKNL